MTPRDLADSVICPRCGAGVGERCVTRTGNPATWPHSARTNPLYDLWYAGMVEGEYGMARMVLETPAANVPLDDSGPTARLVRASHRAIRDWEANQ